MSNHFISKATVTAADANAMQSIGYAIGERLFPNAFIALFGELGSGKTTLTKGIASALDIIGIISPTFTIVRSYVGRLALDHFDAYRIEDADELTAIGYADYLSSESVIVMEWCENVLDALPLQRLELHLEGSGNDVRTISVIADSDEYQKIMEALEKC